MIAANTNFDCVLDQVLACRTDPAVPVDLARRIVVRTASLPQLTSTTDGEIASPSPPIAQARRHLRRSWAGGALAASLAAFAIGSSLLFASSSNQVDRLSAPDQLSPQLAVKDDITLAPPASPVAEVRSPEDLQVSSNVEISRATSTVSPGLGNRPSQADVAQGVVVVSASLSHGTKNTDSLPFDAQESHLNGTLAATLPRAGSQAESFSLAASDQSAVRVYGPVLEPETGREPVLTTFPVSGASTAFGFAGSNPTGGAAFFQGK